MGIEKYEVPVDKLEWHCDPALFAFDCTKDLAPLREFVGQDRALRAIEFGLSMDRDGYNIYVAGMTGTGKTSAVKSQIDKLLAEKQALQQAQPPEDWLYIYNFSNLERPQVINLPQGKGKIFKEQMDGLLQRIKEELAKAFASEEYKAAREKAVDAGQSGQKKLFEEISDEALKEGFRFQITPVGPALIPLVDREKTGRAAGKTAGYL